jgi:hypothetical protein
VPTSESGEPLIKIEVLQICRTARLSQANGQGSDIFGITDTFRFPAYPATVPELGVFCRFRLPAKSHVRGKLGFVLDNPEGKHIWFQNGTIDLFTKPSREEHTSVVSDMFLGLGPFRFDQAGTYDLKAIWEPHLVASTPLHLLYPMNPKETPSRAEVVSG